MEDSAPEVVEVVLSSWLGCADPVELHIIGLVRVDGGLKVADEARFCAWIFLREVLVSVEDVGVEFLRSSVCGRVDADLVSVGGDNNGVGIFACAEYEKLGAAVVHGFMVHISGSYCINVEVDRGIFCREEADPFPEADSCFDFGVFIGREIWFWYNEDIELAFMEEVSGGGGSQAAALIPGADAGDGAGGVVIGFEW